MVEELADVIEAPADGTDLSAKCGDPDHAGAVSLDISAEMTGLDYCPSCRVVSYSAIDRPDPGRYSRAPLWDSYR